MKLDSTVMGMTCSRCAAAVERALKTPGVLQAQVSLATERASIEYDPQIITPEQIAAVVAKAGYTLVLPGPDSAATWQRQQQAKQNEYQQQKNSFILGLVCSLPLLALSMGRDFSLLGAWSHAAWVNWVFWLLATPVQFITGLAYYKGAWRSILNRQPNMDLLVALGSSVAYVYSAAIVLSGLDGHVYFETAALIITFIKLGKLLEMRARGQASTALNELMAMAPPLAIIINERGQEQQVPVSSLCVGQVFVVKPGALVPVDGQIVSGHSNFNQALLSGESTPVSKGPGDAIYAATMNFEGRLLVKATAVGSHTALARIVEMVRRAQESKAQVERLADRVAGIFVPIIVGLALITFCVWWLGAHNPNEGLLRLVAVLVVACPCALGLATPAAVMVGMGQGARMGILFRNSHVLEKIAQVNTVILDKTGTITQGKTRLSDYNPEHLLLAASLEANSEHPLALALKQAAQEHGLTLSPVEDFKAIPGRGVSGRWQEQHVYIGAIGWPAPLPSNLQAQAEALSQQGKTVSAIWLNHAAIGLLAMSDEPKPEGQTAIAALHAMGLKVAMLSGDSQQAANFIAAKVGIKEIYAEALPEDKERIIASLERAAFVGDGINDAPALARAYVGIALGGGADAAKEAGEITLVSGRLDMVPAALKLGRAIMRVIKQNLFWAFMYNLALIPLAAGVFYACDSVPMFLRQLHPAAAAAAMAFSSLTVLANSLRLRQTIKSERQTTGAR